MPKVTVLIAVYNAEAFLPECLDSLLAQTLPDFQAVCVDDASTDASLSVLRDYAARDPRFEVVRLTKNVGIAGARNAALSRSKGDFICMLDADDWLSADALELAVDVFDKHPQTDAVLFQFMLTYLDHEQLFPSRTFDVLEGRRACELSIDWQIHGIYMLRAAIHHRYPYDDICRLFSDENTARVHYAASREVRYCQGVYYYRQHQTSMTHKPTVRQFDKLRAKESLIRSLTSFGFDLTRLTKMLRLDVVDLYMFYHVHGHELSAADRRYGLQEIRRVWATIDRLALEPATITKFGYRPCATFRLFRLQEWLYFTLRGLLGRNK